MVSEQQARAESIARIKLLLSVHDQLPAISAAILGADSDTEAISRVSALLGVDRRTAEFACMVPLLRIASREFAARLSEELRALSAPN